MKRFEKLYHVVYGVKISNLLHQSIEQAQLFLPPLIFTNHLYHSRYFILSLLAPDRSTFLAFVD